MKKAQADSPPVNITLVYSVTDSFGASREQRPKWVCWEFKINRNELGKDLFIYVTIRLWMDGWQYEWKKNGGLFQRERSCDGHFIPLLSKSREDEREEVKIRIKKQNWGCAGARGDGLQRDLLRSPWNATPSFPPNADTRAFMSGLLSLQDY